MHRAMASGKPLSTLDEPRKLRDRNGSVFSNGFWTKLLPRRLWLIVALLPISFLAVIGAVVEFTGLWTQGGSILPLLVWLAVWLASVFLLIAQIGGMTTNSGQEAVVKEVVDALSIGVGLYDSAGKLHHCNEAFRQTFPDSAMHGDVAAITAAITGGAARSADIGGDHELADGRWLRLERRGLADGGCVITALDISRIVALEEDSHAGVARFREFISAAAEWIWETDVLHRFSMIRTIDADGDNSEVPWMIGRSLEELAGGDEDANGWAARRCMMEMNRRGRLRDIPLALYVGGEVIKVRLGGVPRYDGKGDFLGYRGVGLREEPPPGGAPAPETRPAPDGPTGPLLLVDDSFENRKLATSILNRMGYAVDDVDDGPKAVEAVRTGSYSAVLMDIWMPEMDGFEVTAAIRELPSPKGDLPIIAMTAHTGEEEHRRCLEAGMDEHIGKPIDRGMLAAVLHRLAGPPAGAVVLDESRDHSPPRDATTLVNDSVLQELKHDAGPALVNELIAAYMAETDERLGRIEAAIAAGNLEDIAADAHAMKSSSGTFSALPLQALSARLEAAALQGDATAIAAAHGELPQLVMETWRAFATRGYRQE